jgi:hypothetical protein
MTPNVRHQLFPKRVNDRLDALAVKSRATKSGILTDAVTARLNRRGASELEERFAMRLDRTTRATGRVDRDTYVILATLALFIRRELSIQVPLAENDRAGRTLAAKRFDALVSQVSRPIARGRRKVVTMPEQQP